MDTFILPEWRKREITTAVITLFFENSGIGAGGLCAHLMKKHRMLPVPYKVLSGGLQKILCRKCGRYGLIIPLDSGVVLFLYNSLQSREELRRTVWHELGHIRLGHIQSSQLAEAEANHYMKTATVLEAMLNNITEGLPMDAFIKTA